jgi:methylenetetrahydrofolate reductase (NADPH)
MHINDIFAAGFPTISFEFFPPRNSDGASKLASTISALEAFRPAFASVTYGAGGSTRDSTLELVLHLKQALHWDPVPHLTCTAHSQSEITQILETYAAAKVSNILALRGDPPRDAGSGIKSFKHASELIRLIRDFEGCTDPRGFGIGVAGFPEGHPGTPNRLLEMDYLKAKVDAGADYICTQLFYDNRDFYDFRERCEYAGIHIPILAGIMPATSPAGLRRTAELAGGTRIPACLLKALKRANGDADAFERIGIDYATEQCGDLIRQGISGLHFYTLNQRKATESILQNIGYDALRLTL